MLCAIGAFCLWGFMPVYFKILNDVPPLEMLGHRVFWSALLLILVLLLAGQWQSLMDVIKRPRLLVGLAISSVLIALNWLIFIWGVTHDRILETSLGYYINPLLSVLLGFLFFRERLNRPQLLAIGLAVVAVSLQIYRLGSVPWVAFSLACSFGFYGLMRKQLSVPAATGLAVETLFLLPMTLGYFICLWQHNLHSFRVESPDTAIGLMLAGVITTVPLVLFNLAARRLSLTVLGVLQYLGPSISFAVGVLIYNEPLGAEQIQTFALIWLALAIFTADGMRRQRKKKQLKKQSRAAAQKEVPTV